MDIAWFPNHIAQNGQPVMAAMISALEARGHHMIKNSLSADAAVIWSMLWAGRMRGNREIFEHYRTLNRPVLIIEVGCLSRGQYWKVGINGTLPRTNLARPAGSGRSQMLDVRLKPWRKVRGDHIVICLQRTESWQWPNTLGIEQWLTDIMIKLRANTDRPVVIRPHPRQRVPLLPKDWIVHTPKHQTGTYDDFDLERSLAQAWAVINYNSHPGIQSVIQGVPAFVDTSSLAAPVANLDLSRINDPVMPDRELWFDDLAWTEFSVAEIVQGMPLDGLVLS